MRVLTHARVKARSNNLIVVAAAAIAGRRRAEQCVERQLDARGVGADEQRHARFDALAALGDVPHHDRGYAKRCRFFLQSARVRQCEVRTAQQKHRLRVVDWWQAMYVGSALERAARCGLYSRSWMHRKHECHALTAIAPRRARNDVEDGAHSTGAALVFAPVCGEVHHARARVALKQQFKHAVRSEKLANVASDVRADAHGGRRAVDGWRRVQLPAHPAQRINDRVSSHPCVAVIAMCALRVPGARRVAIDALRKHVALRLLGGRPVQARQQRHRLSIVLLGKRCVEAVRTQSRFDVAHRNATVECSGGCRHSRRRVALHDDQRRLQLLERRVDELERACVQPSQRLAPHEHTQPRADVDAELCNERLQDVGVLAGHAHRNVHRIATRCRRSERPHHRCHLDGFWPSANHSQHHRPSCGAGVLCRLKRAVRPRVVGLDRGHGGRRAAGSRPVAPREWAKGRHHYGVEKKSAHHDRKQHRQDVVPVRHDGVPHRNGVIAHAGGASTHHTPRRRVRSTAQRYTARQGVNVEVIRARDTTRRSAAATESDVPFVA
mmetsp:Transcript_49036/g.120160  ORF Transcript_49036/g.120160 Transcript_49036/m.120160 type:complete len:553 (-) Transcript_49036:562-2220(-)